MIRISLPYSLELLKSLLYDFGWDFERMLASDSNHRPGRHYEPEHCKHPVSIAGDWEQGYYVNAAYACPQCYPSSNPAMLEWDGETITLECSKESTKPERMLMIHRVLHKEDEEDIEVYAHAYLSSYTDIGMRIEIVKSLQERYTSMIREKPTTPETIEIGEIESLF